MSSLSRWGALAALCLLCTQQAHGQAPECGGDYVCIDVDPTAVIAWAGKRGPELHSQPEFDPVSPGTRHRCMDTPVNVIAGSDGERRLVCSSLSPNSVANSDDGRGGGISPDHDEGLLGARDE